MSAYDILLAFDRFGQIAIVKKSADEKFTVLFADLAAPLANANANAHDEPAHQPAKRPKVDNHEPTIHETTELNNYCWMNILERLHVRDLYVVADTCKHFRAIAKRVFHERFKHRQFKRDDLVCGENQSSAFIHAIRTFMPNDVQIPWYFHPDIVVRTMVEYCADLEQLDTYNPRCLTLQSETIAALWPILPRLKKLKMYAEQMPPANDHIVWHTEQLGIWYETASLPIHIKMPKLTALTFDSIDERNDPLIFGLLANHPQIDALTFISVKMSINELWSVPHYVPNIKSLSLICCNIDGTRNVGARSVGGFKRLKEIFINGQYFGELQPLLNRSPIQRLRLRNVNGTGLIVDICCFTTITHLCVENGDTEIAITHSQWMWLVKALNQLQSLRTKRIEITLLSVKCILKESVTLNELVIMYPYPGKLEIITAECDAISALIAARPELSVNVCSEFPIDVSCQLMHSIWPTFCARCDLIFLLRIPTIVLFISSTGSG